MDDAMFEGLTKGLDQGPIGANVVLNSALQTPTTVMPVGYTAEPAQVMVMVQNTRAVQAETKLASLKTAVAGIIGLVIIVLFAVVYFFLSRRKKPEYKGIELPGAPLQDIQKVAPQMMPQPLVQQSLMHQPPLVQQPSMQPFGADRPNVVRVHGPIPLWTSEDSRDEPEPRVSESDSSIASLVKQREIFTKDLELSMAQAQTQQQR